MGDDASYLNISDSDLRSHCIELANVFSPASTWRSSLSILNKYTLSQNQSIVNENAISDSLLQFIRQYLPIAIESLLFSQKSDHLLQKQIKQGEIDKKSINEIDNEINQFFQSVLQLCSLCIERSDINEILVISQKLLNQTQNTFFSSHGIPVVSKINKKDFSYWPDQSSTYLSRAKHVIGRTITVPASKYSLQSDAQVAQEIAAALEREKTSSEAAAANNNNNGAATTTNTVTASSTNTGRSNKKGSSENEPSSTLASGIVIDFDEQADKHLVEFKGQKQGSGTDGIDKLLIDLNDAEVIMKSPFLDYEDVNTKLSATKADVGATLRLSITSNQATPTYENAILRSVVPLPDKQDTVAYEFVTEDGDTYVFLSSSSNLSYQMVKKKQTAANGASTTSQPPFSYDNILPDIGLQAYASASSDLVATRPNAREALNISMFQFENINHFTKCKGFESLGARIQSLSLHPKRVEFYLACFKEWTWLMKPQTAQKVAKIIQGAVFQRYLALGDAEIKSLDAKEADRLSNIAADIYMSFSDSKPLNNSSGRYSLDREMFLLRLMFKFARCSKLAQRLVGIKYILETLQSVETEENNTIAVAKSNSKKKGNDIEKSLASLVLTTNHLCEFILGDKVINILLSENIHVEIVKRIVPIALFLGRKKKIDRGLLEVIWNVCTQKDEANMTVLFSLIVDLVPMISPADRIFMFDMLIQKFPFDSYDDSGETLRMIYNFTVASMGAPDFQPSSHFFGLDLLWNYIQDENHSTPPSADAIREAMNLIVQLLSKKDHCASKRWDVLEKCAVNLAKKTSIPQTLVLLEQVIQTYPQTSRSLFSTDKMRTQPRSQWGILEAMESKHKVLSHWFEDLKAFSTKALSNAKKLGKDEIDGAYVEKSCYTNLEHLQSRLGFLMFVLKSSSISLNQKQMVALWEIIVNEAFSSQARDTGLAWFGRALSTCEGAVIVTSLLSESQCHALGVSSSDSEGATMQISQHHQQQQTQDQFYALSDDLIKYVFNDAMVKVPVETLSPLFIAVYLSYFVTLNLKSKNFRLLPTIPSTATGPFIISSQEIADVVERQTQKILGIEQLWRSALFADDDLVAYLSMCWLSRLHFSISPKLKTKDQDVYIEFVKECTDKIQQNSKERHLMAAERSAKLLRTFLSLFIEVPSTPVFVAVLPPVLGEPGSLTRSEAIPTSATTSVIIELSTTSTVGELRSKAIEAIQYSGNQSKLEMRIVNSSFDNSSRNSLNSSSNAKSKGILLSAAALNPEALQQQQQQEKYTYAPLGFSDYLGAILDKVNDKKTLRDIGITKQFAVQILEQSSAFRTIASMATYDALEMAGKIVPTANATDDEILENMGGNSSDFGVDMLSRSADEADDDSNNVVFPKSDMRLIDPQSLQQQNQHRPSLASITKITLTYNPKIQQYIELLFTILDNESNTEHGHLAKSTLLIIWECVQLLPTERKYLDTLRTITNAQNWETLFSGKSSYRLLYALQMVYGIVNDTLASNTPVSQPNPSSNGNGTTQSVITNQKSKLSAWAEQFVSSGGIKRLEAILSSFQDLVGYHKNTCLVLIFKLLTIFIRADPKMRNVDEDVSEVTARDGNSSATQAMVVAGSTKDQVNAAASGKGYKRLSQLLSRRRSSATTMTDPFSMKNGRQGSDGFGGDYVSNERDKLLFELPSGAMNIGVSNIVSQSLNIVDVVSKEMVWHADPEMTGGNASGDGKGKETSLATLVHYAIQTIINCCLVSFSEEAGSIALGKALESSDDGNSSSHLFELILLRVKSRKARRAAASGLFELCERTYRSDRLSLPSKTPSPIALFRLLQVSLDKIIDASVAVDKVWQDSKGKRARKYLSRNCEEFFRLLCGIVIILDPSKHYSLLKADELFNTATNALIKHVPTESASSIHDVAQNSKDVASSNSEDHILVGLLRLIRALSFRGPFTLKAKAAEFDLTPFLYERCLFPLSKVNIPTQDLPSDVEIPNTNVFALCQTQASREAAYDLLTELCELPQNLVNFLDLVSEQGIGASKNERGDWRVIREWKYDPESIAKHPLQYSGLKNQGATCYMNSLVQQLYHVPTFADGIMAIKNPPVTSATFHLQNMFASMSVSDNIIPFETLPFCKSLKDIDGEPLQLSEQKDVQEFSNLLFDTLERECPSYSTPPNNDNTESTASPPSSNGAPRRKSLQPMLGGGDTSLATGGDAKVLLEKHFIGKYTQQIISKDPSHPYKSERNEPFFLMQLDIKNKKDILEALDSFVQGDRLVGDNQFSLPSGEKVDAVMRYVVKDLPPHLIINLKRFEFNYETMTKAKLNDHCAFPMVLNMEPFTYEYITRKEAEKAGKSGNESKKGNSDDEDDVQEVHSLRRPKDYYMYELVGILTHSGSIDYGHYFSFIKEREPRDPSVGRQWFEFNDRMVWPYPVDRIPLDCFGGVDIITQPDGTKMVKPRMKSAYILVYDRISSNNANNSTSRGLASSSSFLGSIRSLLPETNDGSNNKQYTGANENLVEYYTHLYSNGDGKNKGMQINQRRKSGRYGTMSVNGSFSMANSALFESILSRAATSTFEQDAALFAPSCFRFVRDLLKSSRARSSGGDYDDQLETKVMKVATRFFVDVLAHSSPNYGQIVSAWARTLAREYERRPSASKWLLEQVSMRPCTTSCWLHLMLLECPVRETRTLFARLLFQCVEQQKALVSGKDYLDLKESIRPTNTPDHYAETVPLCRVAWLMDALCYTMDNPLRKYETHEFFQLVLGIIKLGYHERKRMLNSDALSKLINIYISMREIIPSPTSANGAPTFGSQSSEVHYITHQLRRPHPAADAIVELICTCRSPGSGKASSSSPYFIEEPSAVPLTLRQIDADKSIGVGSNGLMTAMIENDRISASRALCHISWESQNDSTRILDLVLTALQNIVLKKQDQNGSTLGVASQSPSKMTSKFGFRSSQTSTLQLTPMLPSNRRVPYLPYVQVAHDLLKLGDSMHQTRLESIVVTVADITEKVMEAAITSGDSSGDAQIFVYHASRLLIFSMAHDSNAENVVKSRYKIASWTKKLKKLRSLRKKKKQVTSGGANSPGATSIADTAANEESDLEEL